MRYLHLNKGLIMKKILITLFFLVHFSYANISNGLALVVDKEPITFYDISSTMKKLKIDKNKAIELLINEKIEQAQMKQFGIFTTDAQLKDAISKMLEQTNSTKEQLLQSLKAKNQSYKSFEENFKKDLNQRKLYETILSMAKFDYSDQGAKTFYEQHSDEFTIFSNFEVEIFSADNERVLQNFKDTQKINPQIKRTKEFLNPNNADLRLLALLSRVKIGEYSPVLKGANSYTLYKIYAKNGTQDVNFNQIKNEVLNFYVNEQRKNYIKDYFEKLRSKADIEYFKANF